MPFSGAAHTRLSAIVIALVSVLFGSAYHADLAAQMAKPETANVLYETRTFDDWSVSSTTPEWVHLDGMLLNNGSHRGGDFGPLFAPYRPTSANYAVEAEIRAIRREGHSFGVVVRENTQQGSTRGGYAGGVGENLARPVQRTTSICYLDGQMSPFVRSGCIAESEVFDPGTDWHTHRIEARGNVITLLIDGRITTQATDNRFLSPGRVGLWSSGHQLEVRSFRVIALPQRSNP